MKKFKNSLLLSLFTTFVNSFAYADAVYPSYSTYSGIDLSSTKSIVLFLVYVLLMIAVATLVCVIYSSKKNGNEERFKKVVSSIEEAFYLLSILFGTLYVFVTSFSNLVGGIISMIVYALTVIVSSRLRYKFKEIRGSNVVFYLITILIIIISSVFSLMYYL